jgi:hypothetical protein
MRPLRDVVAFDLPDGWEIRSSTDDRIVCGPSDEHNVTEDALSTVFGVFVVRRLGSFGDWVTATLAKRGVTDPPSAATVSERPALACEWTDGAANVFSVFVTLDEERSLEFECSSQNVRDRSTALTAAQVEELGRAVLSTVRWT